MSKRNPNYYYLLIVLLVAGLALFLWQHKELSPIRIGVLHSLTGTMAEREKPLVDAVQLAVNEINVKGGVLGRPLEMVIADGQSDPAIFATQAEHLITQEHVSVIFGCWTSASRKAVKPIVEKYNHLLFYPVQYEGLEQSPNIIYTGLVPNQQIVPALYWALKNLGKRVYLIESDDIFSRITSRIMTDFIRVADAKLLARRYLPLDSPDVTSIVKEIETLKPDVILNPINVESNTAFFQAFSQSSAKETPVLSFGVSEHELKHYPFLKNHYAAQSYFQSINTPENQKFIADYQHLSSDKTRGTSEPIEAAYFGVHLWAQAVNESKSSVPENVDISALKQGLHAPSGPISIDSKSRHTWKTLRIGKAEENGQFKEIYHSKASIRPTPFPYYRPRAEWADIINSIKKGGDND